MLRRQAVLIARLRDGDRSALDVLMPMVYSELHKIAAGHLKDESRPHTLQATALVHEAYIRLLGRRSSRLPEPRALFGVAANLLRQILVDHARARQAAKRGGRALTLAIDESLDGAPARESTVVALDDALNALARTDENKARLVELRFFGGMQRPGTFRYLHQKADNLNTMGNLLALTGDIDGARACFRKGLEIAETLPKQDGSFNPSVIINELRESEKKLPQPDSAHR